MTFKLVIWTYSAGHQTSIEIRIHTNLYDLQVRNSRDIRPNDGFIRQIAEFDQSNKSKVDLLH